MFSSLIKSWGTFSIPPLTCIYSQASLQENTRVTAGWERAIQSVSVTATRVFWELLFVPGKRLPYMFHTGWEAESGDGDECQSVLARMLDAWDDSVSCSFAEDLFVPGSRAPVCTFQRGTCVKESIVCSQQYWLDSARRCQKMLLCMCHIFTLSETFSDRKISNAL